MGQIEIEIVKEGKDILITSTEGRQIKIPQSNNELKALFVMKRQKRMLKK